jgi:N-acetylglucosamine repressor
MRRINPDRFQVATRGTSREINSRIVLSLVRERQPISRADLARAMGVSRAAVTLIVNDLLAQRLVVEHAATRTMRGRRPLFLSINARRRSVVAVDIRASETFVQLMDLNGQPISPVVAIPSATDPRRLVRAIAKRIASLLAEFPDVGGCEGLGVIVPGMVERTTMRVLHAPTLGWRDVDIRDPLAAATGLPVQIENSGRACAFAQWWSLRGSRSPMQGDLVFVSVSDGVGVGVVMGGEVLRGSHNIAGEFGHVPLSLDGPRCSCGSNGCWEAYVSNLATLARYFGRAARYGPQPVEERPVTVTDLIGYARAGDAKALAALHATARYLGLGLASVINALNPAFVVIGGEITEAWDLIEGIVRSALGERALTPAAAATDIRTVAASEHPRLQGAAALVIAPSFAAPVVA